MSTCGGTTSSASFLPFGWRPVIQGVMFSVAPAVNAVTKGALTWDPGLPYDKRSSPLPTLTVSLLRVAVSTSKE